MEFYFLLLIVLFYSFIQSITGVGILLFGTPTLLLMGYSFINALWILLPVSCVLSVMQIINGSKLIDSKKEVFFYTIPALIISLFMVIKFNYLFNIKAVIGSILILISILRLSNLPFDWIDRFIMKGKKFAYILIGLIHGVSNLGGAPLSVVVSSIHNERSKVTVNIAFCYFILAVSQLFILSIFQRDLFEYKYLALIPFVAINYLIMKKFYIKKLQNDQFNIFINIIILMFGVACIL